MACQFEKSQHSLHRSGFPDAPFPKPDLYDKMGFELIDKVIRDQHVLLHQSSVAHLYGDDPVHFEKMVGYTANYFIEMLGGPKVFIPVRGEPKLGRRHKPFMLTPQDRVVWLETMREALHANQVPQEYAQEIWDWVEPLSMRFLSPRIEPENLERLSLTVSHD